MIDRNLNNIEISCYQCVQRETERNQALRDLEISREARRIVERERDVAVAAEKRYHGFLQDLMETEETPEWIAIDIRRFLKAQGR